MSGLGRFFSSKGEGYRDATVQLLASVNSAAAAAAATEAAASLVCGFFLWLALKGEGF